MLMKNATLTLMLVFALTSSASAQIIWDGSNSDDWADVLNWPGGVPAAGPISAGGIGSGGDVRLDPAGIMPVAQAGETIGATVINNWTTPFAGGSTFLLTFESGSNGDFYNMSSDYGDATSRIDYDIQAGAQVDVANELTLSTFGAGSIGLTTITLGGTISAGNFHDGGSGSGDIDFLLTGLLEIGGDDSADTAASILSGAFHTSVAGGTVVTSYDGGTDITSTFVQVVPEPTSLALLMMAGIASVMFSRRGK